MAGYRCQKSVNETWEIKARRENFSPTFVPKTLNDDVSGSIALNRLRERLNRLPPGRYKSMWICEYINEEAGSMSSVFLVSEGLDPAIVDNS